MQPASALNPLVLPPLTAGIALQEFNVITFGNFTTGSHVDGRALVGGSLTSTNQSEFEMKSFPTGAGKPAGLTVVGNITGPTRVNNSGGVLVGGSISNSGSYSSLQINGNQTVKLGGTSKPIMNAPAGALTTGVPNLASNLQSDVNSLKKGMLDLSGAFKAMAPTAGDMAILPVDQINGSLLLKSTGDGFNVIDLAGSDFSKFAGIKLDTSGTTIINVSGTSITIAESFGNVAGTPAVLSQSPSIIWNFYEATSLTFQDRDFYGTILAPLANATMRSMTLNGSVVFNSLDAGNNEIHGTNTQPDVSNAVPETSTWAMLIIGFGAMGGAIRCRRRQEEKALA